MKTIIETKNLSKRFNEVDALTSLNLKVQKNSIFGFLGPNGSGKTTTMKLLLGLTKPTSGDVLIFDQNIKNNGVGVKARIGYLPQNFDLGSLKHMTARELLRFTARFYFKGPKQDIEDRVQEMLDLVGLTDKADRPIEGFSGGEKQRLGIAQAQVNYPDLLILDEPAPALDPIGRHDVLTVMERLRNHTTIFYSTHILDDVQKVSYTVAILNKGQLIAQGSIDVLLQSSDSVVYVLKLKGDTSGLQEKLNALAWVSNVELLEKNGHVTWQVSVNDKEVAETELLKILISFENIRILGYQEKSYELEDVFLKLMEE